MQKFFVSMQFEIPVAKGEKNFRTINKAKLKEFWEEANEYADYMGCYVFSLKAAKGELPWYVGRAIKQGFKKECFSSHKLEHYISVLSQRKGTPYLRFVYLANSKGSTPEWVIVELEERLIANAAQRNGKLSNRTLLGKKKWVIDGVDPSGRGKSTNDAKALKKLIGLK